MADKESSEYGFMATLDDAGVAVSDSNGGGNRFAAYTRDEAIAAIAGYIRDSADYLAECMAEDLFDEDSDDSDDDEG